MKKTALINSDISNVVSTMGHTDEITICDAGLPIPSDVKRIDLALTYGVPTFMQTVKMVLSELQIEGVILANEFPEVSPELHAELIAICEEEQAKTGKSITISYVSHEALKVQTKRSRAIVRTGECTAYANVIFQSGVVF